jgi:hypothetical protein
MRPLLLPLLLLSLPLHAEPLQGGAWALTLQYSVDGKQWPAAEAPRMECVLPEQASKVNSHVRRSLQVFGCRLQKLQMNGAQGEGLADCWPNRQVVDLRFKAQQQGGGKLLVELQSAPGAAPLHGRLVAQRVRECTAQEQRITRTRLDLEAEDGSGAY